MSSEKPVIDYTATYQQLVGKNPPPPPTSTTPYASLAIDPEIFNTIDGPKDYYMGAWADKECFPAALQNTYKQRGYTIRFPLNTPLSNVSDLYGSKQAGELVQKHYPRYEAYLSGYKKAKIGSKMVAGLYVLGAIWLAWYKYWTLSFKENWRQKKKYIFRKMDPSVPKSELDLKMEEKHKQWLTSYYEEEEDEE
jgi:hypothetical protein